MESRNAFPITPARSTHFQSPYVERRDIVLRTSLDIRRTKSLRSNDVMFKEFTAIYDERCFAAITDHACGTVYQHCLLSSPVFSSTFGAFVAIVQLLAAYYLPITVCLLIIGCVGEP